LLPLSVTSQMPSTSPRYVGHLMHERHTGRARERNVTGAERNVTGAERNVTGAERNVTGAERNVTGAERHVAGAATGREQSVQVEKYVHMSYVICCALKCSVSRY
jgi:hypothetical protein